MKRVVTAELLDSDAGTPSEIRDSLVDLRSINQRFGGFSSVAALLRAVAQRTGRNQMSFLDVAGGTGELAEHVGSELRQEGIRVCPTVLDRAVSHMNSATSVSDKVAGDALLLPFGKGSFDVVGCNLFCHHLEPPEMIRFFNEGLRTARLAVIASDLRRNRVHWIAAHAGKLTYRSRLTRNDAPASVRRAYTAAEIKQILQETNAYSFEVKSHYFQRMGVILWKQPATV